MHKFEIYTKDFMTSMVAEYKNKDVLLASLEKEKEVCIL